MNSGRSYRLFLVLLALLTLTTLASSQTPDTATLHGRVLDPSHAAVQGVQVSVRNTLTGLQRSTVSDSSGNFSISGLPVSGNYVVTASKQGFADARLEDVSLIGGSAAGLTLQLGLAGQRTEITVTSTAGQVNTDSPQLGPVLDEMQMQETPLLNRKITSLPLLSSANRPATNQGDLFVNQTLFTTNGTGRRQTYYEVDGVNAVDTWGRQTIFTSLPLDSLEEMSVLTNPFSAEYGRSAGSAINIVTRSGGNRYHGNVMGLWRPSQLSASLSGYTAQSATSGAQITSDKLVQTAASLSGPIGSKEKTHFFLAGEYSWQDRGSPVTSVVDPGTYIGEYRGWLGMARVDHEINQKNNLFFRAGADEFNDTNPAGAVGGNTLPTVARVFSRHTYTAEVGETATITPTLLNNVRAQFQLASPITKFSPVLYGTQFVVPVATGGTFTTGTSQAAQLQNRQYEVNDTVSWVRGVHTLRFGGDVIRSHSGGNGKEFGGPIFLGQFQYNPCALTLEECETTYIQDINNVKSYTQSYGSGSYTVDDTLWSLFVQDDWRIRRNLTLNLGLRYERQTFTDSDKNFAPRVGFAYDLHGDGNTVVRAGFGIYYSQIVDNAQANYALTGPTGVFNYTATPGQIGFPDAIADAPLPAFPPGAVMPLRTLYLKPGMASYYDQFLPTSTLKGYQDQLLNPYTEQWTFGIEHSLAQNWVLSLDYVGSHSVKVNRPLDVDAPAPFIRTAPGLTRTAQAANCTRPYWIWWYAQNGTTCDPAAATNPQPPYGLVQSDVNNGFGHYNALDVTLNHRFSHNLSMLVTYTWSHAIDNVDPDVPGQNPNDPNFTGAQEIGNAIFDQRHRFVLSGFYSAPFKINFGGFVTLASGLPYNFTTASNNFGDPGATADRPVINGAVVGRNAGRGQPIYDVSPFVERPFALGSERVQLVLRAEAFNVFNHANFVGYNGLWGNNEIPIKGIGDPLTGIANQLPARSLQFSANLKF